VQRLSHPDGGEYSYLGPMWRINGRRPPMNGPAPLVGEHNEDVLGSLTRLTRDEIAALGR
jgi:crotonobetainyl-CoA:carnitine CoA-transferase CaiB-like acyl-CoA transferase